MNLNDPKKINPFESEIKFKPINDGLGFHPFSDGLPYASQNPNTSQSKLKNSGKPQTHASKNFQTQNAVNPSFNVGSGGAWAAGSPTFVTPSTPLSLSQKNSVNQHFKNQFQNIKQPILPTPIEPLMFEETEYGLGYCAARFSAYIVDSVFNLTLAATVLSFALLRTELELLRDSSDISLMLSSLFLYFCNWAAITGQEIAFGNSLGKKVFGLTLKGSGSDAFIRAVAFIPSQLVFGLGIIACLFDDKKRGWHDRFSRTQPEYST